MCAGSFFKRDLIWFRVTFPALGLIETRVTTLALNIVFYLIFCVYLEIIRRGPTFGDFVTIRTEASMQDVTVARLQSTRVQTLLSPLF
jgi:hypothetical protein